MKKYIALLATLTVFALPALAQDDTTEEEDKSILENFLQDNLSSEGMEVTVNGFSGALSREATMREMTFADEDGVWLRLENVALNWNRASVLRGRIEVRELSADLIELSRLPSRGSSGPSAEASDFTLPELPVSINIGLIDADSLVLGAPVLGERIEMTLEGSANLADGEGAVDVALARTDGELGELNLTGSYSNTSKVLALNLLLNEGQGGIAATLANLPGQPALNVTIEGEDPLDDFTANIMLATDGQNRLGGQVRAQAVTEGEGDDQKTRTRIEADLAGDLRPLFEEQYQAFFGGESVLHLDATRFENKAIRVADLFLQTEALELRGNALVNPRGWPQNAQIAGTLAPPDGASVVLPIAGPETRIASAKIEFDYDALRGDGWVGAFQLDGFEREDMSLSSVNVSGAGRLRSGGGDSIPSVGGRIVLAADGIDLGDEALNAAVGERITGDLVFAKAADTPFRFTDVDIAGADYGVTGDVTLRTEVEKLDLIAEMDLNLAADRLARFAQISGQDLKGAANLSITGDVAVPGGPFNVEIEGVTRELSVGISQVDSLLAGESRLSIAADRNEDRTSISRLSVAGPGIALTASGELRTNGSTIDAQIELPDASRLDERLSGRLAVNANAVQVREAWTVEAEAQGPGGLTADISGTGRLEDGGIGPVQATITAALDSIAPYSGLAGRDLAGAANVSASVDADLSTMAVSLVGNLRGQNLSVTMGDTNQSFAGTTELMFDVSRDADGALAADVTAIGPGGLIADITGTGAMVENEIGPIDATINASADSIAPYSGLAGRDLSGAIDLTASVEGNLSTMAVALSGSVQGQNLSLSLGDADQLLAGGSEVVFDVRRDETGKIFVDTLTANTPQVSLTADGTSEGGQSRVNFDARLANLGIFVPEFPGAFSANGTAVLTGDDYRIDVSGQGPGGITMNVSGSLASTMDNANLSINGNVPLALANAFTGQNRVDGTAAVNVNLNGPLALTSLSGTVSTSNARVAAPGLRVSLDPIQANINLGNGRARLEVGAGVSSGGRLEVAGPITLEPPFNADLVIRLQNVGLTDPSLYDTQINGQLTVSGPLTGGARIAGTVRPGVAEIRIPSSGFGVAGNVEGLRHVNEPADVRATRARAGQLGSTASGNTAGGPAFPLDIVVDAPNQVFIRGRGLDAEVGGRLRLTGTTADIVPQGSLSLIRGRLSLLGNRIELTEARATLEGDFDPFIAVTAETTVDDTAIQIRIDGQATDPEITFSSVPDLPQDEIFSRLIFGRSVSEISALQALRLANGIATLTGRSGGGVIGNLRQGFGLADLDVGQNDDGALAVRAGAYISENIYTGVEVGADGEAEVNINLDLTPNLTARGAVSNSGETSLGIYFERDY